MQLFWVIHKLLKYVFSSQNKKHNFFFFLSISVWADVLHLCPVLFSVQEDDSVTPLGHPTVMLQYLSGSRLPVGSSAREQEMELMGKRCHLPSTDTLQSGALTERQSFCKLSWNANFRRSYFSYLLKNWSCRQRLICQILIGELLLHVYVILRQCLTTGESNDLSAGRSVCAVLFVVGLWLLFVVKMNAFGGWSQQRPCYTLHIVDLSGIVLFLCQL